MAIYTVYSKSVFRKISVIDFSKWTVFYGWIFLLITTLISNPEYFQLDFVINLQYKVLISLLYLAVFIVFATIVFASGVKKIGPSRAAIFMNIIPIFGIISSILILGEKFSYTYFPAFIAIMFGVYQVNKKNK